jgi:hypothetical protein
MLMLKVLLFPQVLHRINTLGLVTQLSGIALGYGVDDQGFGSQQGQGIFIFSTVYRPALGPTQHPNQWVPETLSLGVKQSEHEADHSFPSSAKVKMHGAITPLPQYAFMLWCSVKAQGHLYLYLFSDED